MSLGFPIVGPALVAGPSWESRPAGERPPYKSPKITDDWQKEFFGRSGLRCGGNYE